MSRVNVVDSIVITEESDASKVVAEWSALDFDIEGYKELTSAYTSELFLNGSDQNGTLGLSPDTLPLGVCEYSQGITGDYSFEFTKISENGSGLPGALFSLYISDDFSVGADRLVYSDGNGGVLFKGLPEGTFYLRETVTPFGYIPNSTIYKVTLSRTGFEIYYGDNFEKKLSDQDNKVVNFKVEPPTAILTGTKKLTGRTLSSGMFSFIAKDKNGKVVSTGTNGANGVIHFSRIEFDGPGVYTFTVEEVIGGYSAVTYDDSVFTVTVKVTGDGNVEVTYPASGIVFNNSYTAAVKPCHCYARSTKCRKSMEGQIIWEDNGIAGGTRPAYVRITLLRDGMAYKVLDVDSTGNGAFVFCCVPIGKNPRHKYEYRIDELDVPGGYTKTIEGNNVINTLNP